jgi:hypothetical protein
MRCRSLLVVAGIALAGSTGAIRPFKSIRFIIEGAGMPRHTLVDADSASRAYSVIVDVIRHGQRSDARSLLNRPCVRVATYLRSPDKPIETMRLEEADFTYWLYPAQGDRPATLAAGSGAVATIASIGASQVKDLTGYAMLPANLHPAAASCARPAE